MSKITLAYFDFSGSRGEECRLALHIAGVPFEDDRIKSADWPARKASTPFGGLPVLTVEGQPPIAEANAILRLIGNKYDLHPKDEFEAARHEALMGAVEDLRHHMSPIARIKDPAEKRAAREAAATGYLPEWAAHVDKQIVGPFVAGDKIGVADIKLFVALTPFLKGTFDHVPADVFHGSPKLTGVHEAVKNHPKVQEWYAR